jgi:hypothetical protein
VSPTWSALRHHTRETRTALTHLTLTLWVITRPWIIPTASYACFTTAAFLLATPLGWAVAGICLLIAHAQASTHA